MIQYLHSFSRVNIINTGSIVSLIAVFLNMLTVVIFSTLVKPRVLNKKQKLRILAKFWTIFLEIFLKIEWADFSDAFKIIFHV